MKQSI